MKAFGNASDIEIAMGSKQSVGGGIIGEYWLHLQINSVISEKR